VVSIKNVGAPPTSATDLATQGYVGAQIAATNQTQAAIDAQIAAGFAPYADRSYVDAQNQLNATKGYVDAGDATRAHLAVVDVPNGIAGLDATGKVDVGRVPLISTQRWPSPYYSPAAYNTATVTSTGPEALLYTTTVTDPGYLYRPLTMGLVDVSTDTDGVAPVIRVRRGSAVGPIVAQGYGSAESYGISPTFDAVGSGFTGSGSSFTFTHTIGPGGAYLVVDIITYGYQAGFLGAGNYNAPTVSNCRCAGVAMTQLGTVGVDADTTYGRLTRFGLAGVAAGAKTIAVTLSAVTDYVTAGSVSYAGVGSAGTTTPSHGTGNASRTVTAPQGAILVQSFANYSSASLWTPGGGTNHYNNGGNDGAGTYYTDLCISDAAVSTTFTATGDTVDYWAGLVTALLSPTSSIGNHSMAPVIPIPQVGVFNVAFDAVGTGAAGNTNALSWSHTAAAGAYLLVWLSTTAAVAPTVSYGGTPLTLLKSQPHNNVAANGSLHLFGLANVPGGAALVAVSLSGPFAVVGESVSYLQVAAVTALATVFGTIAATSQTLTNVSQGMLVQAFGAAESFTAPAGGTLRYSNAYGGNAAGLVIQDSTAGTAIFTATCQPVSSKRLWSGIGAVLTPASVPSACTGDTPLYVTLAPNGTATVSATTFEPGLWTLPVPV
jgi:hypothetical protein